MTSQEPHEPLVFDRATDYYDRTRALPPAAMDRVVELLTEELGTDTACLEVGVGTGRMALPLARAGVSLVGLDLSMPMMRRLIENAGGQPPFPLLHADATRTPFRSHSLETALVVHVLHLIPAWQDVVDEIFRIVRPAGRVLIDQGQWATHDIGSAVDEQFTEEAVSPKNTAERTGARRSTTRSSLAEPRSAPYRK